MDVTPCHLGGDVCKPPNTSESATEVDIVNLATTIDEKAALSP